MCTLKTLVLLNLIYIGACSTREQTTEGDSQDIGLGLQVDIGFDVDAGLKTDATDTIVATNPVGPNELWPSELPDCVEEEAYYENAVFEIPTEGQFLSRNLAELREYANTFPEGRSSSEVVVLSPGNALIAFSQPGEIVRIGVALARAQELTTPLFVAAYVDHQPVETKLIREESGEVDSANIHILNSEKAEIFEVQFPGSPVVGVRELELFTWEQHPNNPSRDDTTIRKITHYNGVVSPHSRPCLIPAQLSEKTDFENRLGYFPATTMRLNLGRADFRYSDPTMPRYMPVFTAKVGEKLDFLMTIGAPSAPFKLGGQVILFSSNGSVHKTFGVAPPPPEATTSYTSVLRYKLPVTFTKLGRAEYILTMSFDPFIPQSRADGTELIGFPSFENSNSVIIDVVE